MKRSAFTLGTALAALLFCLYLGLPGGREESAPKSEVVASAETGKRPSASFISQRAKARMSEIDKREAGGAAGPSRTRDEALAMLRREVPGVQVDFDPVTGAPKHILAAGRFLAKGDPSEKDPYQTLRAFVTKYAALFGHGAGELQTGRSRLTREDVTAHNGMRTVVWQQEVAGVPVFETILRANLTRNGDLITVGSHFMSDAPKAAAAQIAKVANPVVNGPEALAEVAASLGTALDVSKVMPKVAAQGVEQSQKLSAPGFSDTTAHLSWVPMDEATLRLAWEVETFSLAANEMFRVLVDAENGEVLVRQSLTADISNATYRIFTSDSPTPFTPGHSTPSSTQPAQVSRTLLTTQALNTTASPNGWINDGGNETVGNNVDAHLDLNADNVADTPRPQGSPSRVFDFSFNSASEPTTYRDASVTQLFYYNNWIHDRMYELGFTESAGNFQTNNFGRGGNGNDAVQADAQDGSGTNNANFSTPSDGSPGRMQMYIWPGATPDRDSSFDGDIVVHEYGHGISNRLVGGGVGISAWQSRGMGEGWSDFYAMSLLSEPTDNVNGVYAMGGYSTYMLSGMTTNYYFGIRRYPYCTDMTKAPLTYRDIDPLLARPHTGIPLSPRYSASNADPSQYHAQGEVWCNMLLECRANIINHHGWAVGNELMLRIVTDGLKLTPANPTFIQARDAIIQADLVNNGGANSQRLWAGFAKRGIGASASGPVVSTTTGVVEAYDIPDDLSVTPYGTFAAAGSVGGPMTPANRVFSLQNVGAASINWTASSSQPWLVLSRTSGALGAGDSDTVTASFSSAANNLPTGVHTAVVTFTNVGSDAQIERDVTLTVEPMRIAILSEPFDDPTLSAAWTVTGTGPFRTQVTSLNSPRASNQLTMDSSVDVTYARNEATLTVNLAGRDDVELSFWAKGYSEDSNGPPPSPFINGADFDGVAISADGGTTWYEVQPLRGLTTEWVKYTVDLDAAIASRGLSYGSNFKIRFNQYDNYGISTDGIGIDDILIAQNINSALALALPVNTTTEGASAITATLTVTPVQSSELTVSLSASGPDVSVPASVTVPANTTQITFPVTITDDALLDGTQSVTISALAATFNTGVAQIAVHDNETTTLTVDAPLSAIEGAVGLSAFVTVPVAVDAPVTVTLDASSPAATIPAGVTIPAGQTSAQFFITLADDGFINGTRSVSFTASVTGWTAGTDTMSITDDENANLVLAQTVPSINEGDGLRAGAGRLSINGLTQSDVVISLSSSDVGELTVPASVTLPAGATQVSFDMTAVNDSDLDGPQNVTVTATAPGFIDGTLVVIVQDEESAPAAWNPRPAHLSTNNPVTTDLAWSVSEGNLITNGGFEAGLSGWSFNVPGGPMFRLQTGTLDPTGSDTPTAPYSGTASMIFAPGSSGALSVIYQDVAVPPDGPAPLLQWQHRIRNTGTSYTATQQFRLEIRDPSTDAVLATPFVTMPGSPLFVDWSAQSANLSPWRGRTVRVAFVVQPGSAIINVLLDDIRLQQRPAGSSYDVYFGTNPTPGASELLGTTTAPAWNLPELSLGTTYFWKVITQNGAQSIEGPVWRFSVPAAGPVASFAWSSISTPQNSGTGIPVTITALDAVGHVATGFTGTASLSALLPASTQPSILITEHSTWTTDEFEFMNVTNAPVDVSGWKIQVTHLSSFPAPYVNFVVPNGTTVAAGGIFRLTESGTAPGTYPNFRMGLLVSLATTTSSYVVLRNANDEVVDFVISGGDPRLVSPAMPPEAWIGAAVPAIGSTVAGQTLQRVGIRDNNNASDWQVAVATPGALNTGLTLPFQPGPVAPRVNPTMTAAFTAGVWSGNVGLLGAGTNLRLRATESGGKSGDSSPFTVATPNGTLAISGTATVNEGAGTAGAFGTVTLPSPAASPVTVSFLVNGASQASVADVTIPAGSTSAPFDLSVVDDSLVEGSHNITITPVAAGYASPTALTVGITDNEGAVLTLTAPTSATEGQGTLSAALTITSSAAPLNAVTITLASNDTTEATAPASVVLPAGQTSVTANLTIVNDTLIDLAQNVTLTASAAGFTSGTASVVVNDNEPATIILAAPAVVAENAGSVPAAGTITLGGLAPADMSIALSSSDAASLTAPATVTVLAGQSSATFAVTAVDDSTPEANASVTLTASFAGLTDGTANVSVRDDETASFAFAAISAQKAATPFPVTISARNTSGDAVTGFTGTAALSAAGNTIAPLNTSNFTAGSWTGNVTLSSPSAVQTLTASSGAISGTSAAFAVNAGDLASFALSAVSSSQAANVPFALTATAKDALGQDLTNYAGPARLMQVAAAQVQPQIGTFQTQTTYLPFFTLGYNRGRSTLLVNAAELGSVRLLQSLSLHFTAVSPPMSRAMIRMKKTSLTTLSATASWDNNGWTTVYDSPLTVGAVGWQEFPFTTPWVHDGVSNALVEFVFTAPANGSYSAICSAALVSGYTGMVYSVVTDTSTVNADPTLWSGTSPSRFSVTYRPILRFNARSMRDASPASLTAFSSGVFSGDVAAPYGGTGQTLAVWDAGAGVLSETNTFAVTSAGTLAVSFSGNVTEGGAGITGTVTASVAPSSDLTVALTLSNAADVTIPASVTILAGQTTATFAASAVDDALIESVESVSVTAAGAGYDAGSGSFTITDNDGAVLSVTLPASVTEGGAAATGTVTASTAAAIDVTINLTAAPAGLVTVPASVTLPAGQTSATFSISAVNNTAIDGTRSATVTASTAGWTSGNATLDVLDNEALTLTVNLASTTPREGDLPVSGTVTLSGTTATALTVTLSSDDTSEATVPASVTIAAGASSTSFSLTVVDDALTDGSQPVLLTASAAGFTDGTRSLQVLDNDLAGFAFATVPNPQVRNAPFAVTITSVDVNGALIPTYTGTVNLSAAGSGGAVAITPAVSGSFVNGSWSGSLTATQADTAVEITAAGTGGLTGESNAFDVLAAGPLSQFAISGIGATQTSGTAVPVTVTAQDAAGNPVTSYNGNASFSISAGPSAAEVVTGTGTSTTLLPFWTTNQDVRMQTIYLPSEVGAARTLRSMAFDVVVPPGMDMRNFTIRLKHTSRVDYATAANVVFETTGWTTVYQRDIGIPTVGWNTFVFQTPFVYDGTQNLLVDISYNNSSVSAAAGTVRHTSTSPVRSVYATSASSDGDPLTWNGSVGPTAFSTNTRINLRFSGFLPVTVSPAASGTFASGVWSGDLTFGSSGPGVVLRALNGAGISGQTAPFTLNGAVTDHFDFAAISSPQTSGVNVPVTVTAKDANNMPVPGYTGTAALSAAEQAMKAQTGSGTSTWSIPLGSQSRTQRMQVIYLAAELGGTARRLTGLDLNPTTAPGSTLNNFTIRVKHTSKADFAAAGTAVWESTGWTTVFQGNVTISEAGWVSFPFTTSFDYDGTRNLMVDYSYNNAAIGVVQGFVRYSTAATNRTVLRQTDLDEGDPLAWNEWTAPVPGANTVVPNTRFSSVATLPLTPLVTGSFVNGVWTGNVAVGQPASRVALTATSGASSGTSGLFNVSGFGTLSLTLAPSAAEGASPLSATLTRTGSTVDALTVNLVSSDTTEATLASSMETIPAGDASVTFSVNVVDDALADGPQGLVISAAAAQYISAEASLTVTDNEAAALTVSLPPQIAENGGAVGNGFVRVNQAPASALTVNLVSSDTSELTVPTSVTIAAGALSATFAITAVDDTLMDGTQTVNVTATATGHVSSSSTTQVQDNESFLISLGTTSVVESAAPLSTTVSLSGAVAADVTVNLSVNDGSELLLAPNTSTAGSASLSVTIPTGSTSASIALVPVDDAIKDGNQSVTVTLSAPGFTTTSRFVNVIDDELERYVISPVASPQTVGAAFNVTATAQNISGSTITNRSDTLTLTASNAAGVLAMTPGTVTLASGIGTFSASFAAPAAGVSITASDAQNVSAQSSVFEVLGAGALNRLAWNTLTTPQLIESPINATVSARDAANNILTTYTGPADLKLFSTTADTTIGVGTTSWTTPLGSSAHARTQGIYLASELGAAKRLTGLALNVLTSSTTLLNNFTIRLKHTSSTSFSTAAWESGWTTVFSGTRTYNSTGWQNTVFTRPFDYDGVNNVMVDISFGNLTSGTAVALQASTTASARSVVLNTNSTFNGLPVTWTGTTNTPLTSTNLLNVRFTNATPVTVAGSGSLQNTSGTGTSTTHWPLGTNWHDERTQMIYTPAEVGGAMTINSVALDVSTVPGQVMNAFTIRMKHTSTADYSASAAWEATGWTTVYSSNQTVSATGWNTFTLSTPFAFNGTSNLMVDICFNNTSYTSNGLCRFTTSSTPRVIWYQTDSGFGDPLAWSGTSSPTPNSSTSLPNMRFSGISTSQSSAVLPVVTDSFTGGAWTGSVSTRVGGSSVFFAADDPVTGISGYSNTIAINSSGTLALSFLGTLAEGNGTVANGGTLTLSAAPASTLTVALSSANTAQLTVPATVTVPAGQTSISVPVTLIDDTSIEAPQSIAVTAIAPGYRRVTANAAIADNDGGTFTITAPATVAEGSSSFTATLNTSVASPVAVTVSLNSSDITELTVPTTILLPANATSATFTVTVVDDSLLDGSQNATITASAANWTSGTAVVAVTDNDPPPTFTLFTNTLAEGGTSTTNYVQLASAPASALTVNLSSSDMSVMTVPATVTINAGSTFSYFTTTAPDNALSMGTRYATLSASAAGYRSVGNVVSVADNDASGFRINNITGSPVAGAPVSVTITAIAPDNSTVTAFNGTVNLSALAGDGAVTVTPAVSGTFSSGVWTGNLIFGRIATGVVLSATNAQGITGSSNAFDTTFGALDHFTWATVPSPQQASTPFSTTVTAKDVYDNTVTSFTGTAALQTNSNTGEQSIGAGTSSSSFPFEASEEGARSQLIYLPAEIGGARVLSGLSLNVTTIPGLPLSRFAIRLKHTTTNSYPGSVSFDNTGLTTVYSRASESISTTGWRTFLFDKPFTYNGVQNLLVDIVFDNASSSANGICQASTVSPSRHMTASNLRSWGYGDPHTWSYANNFSSTLLPNIKFTLASDVVMTPTITGSFTSGSWSGDVAVAQSGAAVRLKATSGAYTGFSNQFSVTSLGTFALSLAPTAMEGAAPLTATLSIATPPSSELTVSLNSSNTSAATLPATVTILAGQASVTFPVTLVDDTLLDGTQSTLISATVVGYDAGVATLNVQDDETTTISLSLPATLAENAAASTGTVTLGAAADADITLPLTSSDTTELAVPATVTIPSGSTTASFAITPVDDTVIDFAQNVTVSTSMAGWTGGSASISITDNESTTLSLSFTSTAAEGGSNLTATLSTPSPVQNATTVTLTSTDTTEATVPATATIAAGASSTTFTIAIVNDIEKDGSQTFNITAASSGFTTATRSLTVTDNDVANFLVSAISSPQVRNQPFNVTFTARDINNATITSYAGTPSLSGLDGATALTVSPTTVGSFSAGTRTLAVTVGSFATNAVLTLTDAAAAASGSSNAFTVGSGPHSRFAWSTINSPQFAGSPFPVTITAQDSAGNTVAGFTGTAALTAPTGLVPIGSAGSTVSAPLSTNAHDVRSQLIYTATEMGATARSISSVALNVSTLPGQAMSNFTIRMRHTTQQTYSSFSWESTGWTVCYQANQTISSVGWNTFNFTTPFAYNGTDSLMVDISFNNTSSSTSGAVVSTFISAGVRHMFQVSNSSSGDPLTWTGTNNPVPTFTYDRPDVRFGYGGTGATPNPATTTAFTAGVWTGNVTIPTTATAIQLQAANGSISGLSNTFNVNPSYTLGLSIPASAVESVGSVTGTVTISAAQASAVTVNLSSNDTTEANPAVTTVTIPAGSTSANFTLNIINDALNDGAQTATLTATVAGISPATASITVNDDDLSYFTWNTIASPKTSGAAFSVTVNARTVDNQPATGFTSTAALSGLIDGSPAAATPASTGAFTSGSWTGSVSLIGAGSATLTATSGAATGTSNAFTQNLANLTLSLAATTVESAGTLNGTVFITPVQATDTSVTLASSNTAAATLVSSPVIIPAGNSSVAFSLNIINDTLQDGAQTTTITANSSGSGNATANLTVNDDELSYFTWSTITSPKTSGVAHSVTISARTIDNQVASAFNGSTAAFSISAGAITPLSTGAFASGAWTGNVVTQGSGPVTLAATAGSFTGQSNSFTLTLPSLSVTLPASAIESAGTVSGTVTLSSAQTNATTITLASNDATEALPASSTVTIAAGATSAGFTLNIINDTDKDGAQSATVNASSTFASSGSAGISVIDDEVHNFLVSAIGPQVKNAPFNVTFTARNIDNATITSYAGSPVLSAADDGTPLTVSPASVTGFSAGVRTLAVTVGGFASAAVLTVTDSAASASGTSNSFVVGTGPLSSFAWAAIPPPQVAGVAFPVTLTAKDSVGNTVTSFSGTANLSATDGSSSTRNVGTASATYGLPFLGAQHDMRQQVIYTAADLGSAPVRISSLAVNVTSFGGTATFSNFAIRMKHTTRSNWAVGDAQWESTGWTTVVQENAALTAAGWRTFTFATPFDYDGTSNLMIDFSYDRTATSGSNSHAATTRSAGRAMVAFSNSTAGVPLNWSGSTPTATLESRTPDLRLGVVSPLSVTPAVAPAFTAGVFSGQVSITGGSGQNMRLTATQGAVTGQSDLFEMLPVALTITPEPAFTGGLSNSLSWNQPVSGLEYQIEQSTTSDFATPVSSAFQSTATSSHSGLIDGQAYHYRVRMRRGTTWTSPWSPVVTSTQDASPPVLTIPAHTTTSASAVLAGTASDPAGVASVTVAGNAATTTDAFAHFNAALSGLVDGSNTISVTAADNAVPPNTTTASITVFRIAAPTGDDDNNGINSLLEHALGIPAAALTARSLLPVATVETDSGDNQKYLCLQFRRRIERAGLTYTVETSTDLVTWDDTGASIVEKSAVPTGDGITELVTVRITPAMSLGGAKYVRLRVTSN